MAVTNTAQNGNDMLLKVDTAATGGPTFTTVAGIRANEITINREVVDITNQGSAGWRELLQSGGVASLKVGGSGVFVDDTATSKVTDYVLAKAVKAWQMIVPALGTFQASFVITSLKLGSNNDKEVTFSIELEATGAVTFTGV